MYLLGLDVGSTGCKAIVFDAAGNIKGSGFQEYDIETDETGKAEQDADAIWRITEDVLTQAVSSAGTNDIKALSVSVQGDSAIPVDKDFNALSPAILGMDYRSAPQSRRLAEEIGDFNLFEKTGMRSHPINAAVKAVWLKDTSPSIYEKANKIVTYADFILGKLGAEPAIDFSMASRTGVFDLKKREWSGDIIAAFGLDADKYSPPCPSGKVVGKIAPGVAEKTGLSPDTFLVTGGHDQTCAGIGAGLVVEGPALLSTGTAEVLSTAFKSPKLTKAMYEAYYPCYIHAEPSLYFTFALNHVGGLLLKWYRDNLGQPEVAESIRQGDDAYSVIVGNVPEGPSRVMVLPHFNGSGTPTCDMDSKGAIVGLTMATTRHDIVRAVLESQTYELKINVECMQDAGIPISSLIAAGGGAKSSLWLQIRADVLDCPVRTLRIREAACLGAAILSGAATGVYSSIAEGVYNTVRYEKEYIPVPGMVQKYEEKYHTYKKLYPALRSFNKML
jgi:xylulokinase